MQPINIAELRQRLRVHGNNSRYDGENGIPHGYASQRLYLTCELEPNYQMTCKLNLGYCGSIRFEHTVNETTVLFLEMGKALGIDVLALVEQFANPVIQDGWKLVPIEPTEDMVINGFESKPDSHFSPAQEWDEYEAMSGCQQAAHRAKLCWAAMLRAAPEPVR